MNFILWIVIALIELHKFLHFLIHQPLKQKQMLPST